MANSRRQLLIVDAEGGITTSMEKVVAASSTLGKYPLRTQPRARMKIKSRALQELTSRMSIGEVLAKSVALGLLQRAAVLKPGLDLFS